MLPYLSEGKTTANAPFGARTLLSLSLRDSDAIKFLTRDIFKLSYRQTLDSIFASVFAQRNPSKFIENRDLHTASPLRLLCSDHMEHEHNTAPGHT